MSAWTPDELRAIAHADELEISSRRRDGSLRPFVTIWTVRSGDDVFVRSAYGYDNGWFQRALRSGEGRIRTGGIERDVVFEVPEPDVGDVVTAAYQAKYARYGARMVGTVVSPEAVRSSLRVQPR
jgi:hypothetical protein